MRELYLEASCRIQNEQLIIISLDKDILGIEREAIISWDLLCIWAGLLEIDVQHLYVWMK